MTIIPIIRKSIKKNPDAGNTQTVEPAGAITASITVNHLHEPITDIEAVKAVQYWTQGGVITKVEYVGFGDGINEFFKRLKKLKLFKYTTYSLDYPHTIIQHAPEPKYYFKFNRNVKVACTNCGHKVKYKDIEWRDTDDGDDYSYCNKCKEYSTYEHRFERLQDIPKEQLP